MGWSFRKSFQVLPGIRVNLSKRGIGTSIGVKGARVSFSPGRKPQLNVGRGMFRYHKTLGTHTTALPAVMQETGSPSLEIVHVPPFALPERGRYEANATVFQKRKLEEIASSHADLTERFYAIIDSLGRQQAEYILHHYKLQELAAWQAAQLAAQAQEQRELDLEQQRRAAMFPAKVLVAILWSAIIGAFIWWCNVPHNTPVDSSASASVSSPSSPRRALSRELEPAPAQVEAKRPLPTQPTPPHTFAAAVAASQKAALAKYPSLGAAGSAMNQAFLTRYNQWRASKDPRFRDPTWPERLADECAQSQ